MAESRPESHTGMKLVWLQAVQQIWGPGCRDVFPHGLKSITQILMRDDKAQRVPAYLKCAGRG